MEATFDIPDPKQEVLFPTARLASDAVAEGFRSVKEFAELTREHGAMLTQAQAGLILGLTRSRIGQIVMDGALKTYPFVLSANGETEQIGLYISAKDLLAYAQREQLTTGRPSKARLLFASFQRK